MGVYCLALVPANTLPKTPLGGIHLSETKQLFLEGSLHPCNVLMCPHTCVTNLPKPRQKQPGKSSGGQGTVTFAVCLWYCKGAESSNCWYRWESASSAFLFNILCVSRTSLVLPGARSTFTESARKNANSIKMTFLSLYKVLLRPHLEFLVNSSSVMFKEDGDQIRET